MTALSRIIVVGASAGGVEAISRLVRGLPANLEAAVFVVLHIPTYSKSRLPEILSREGTLPAKHGEDGELARAGIIYVAPPDRHMSIRNGCVQLSRGPRENHSRPAIDPAFRSAAREFGPRAIGVVLSGALYDGTAGLMAIKARGGTAVIQDPAEATADSMPRSALRAVDADYVVAVDDMGPLLARLVDSPPPGKDDDVHNTEEPIEAVISDVIDQQAHDDRPNDATIYTCPECGGVLIQSGNGGSLSFRCHVGHAYAPELLLGQKADELEAALWTCLRMLTEKATLTRQVATRSIHLSGSVAPRAMEQAEATERQAQLIRSLLLSMPTAAELVESVTEQDVA